ncbi:MAG: AGCS family alanine or glycine:cation symporter [Planctomycetota bacterium]|jgi:AGCS family alanine or glycine:cation symporter
MRRLIRRRQPLWLAALLVLLTALTVPAEAQPLMAAPPTANLIQDGATEEAARAETPAEAPAEEEQSGVDAMFAKMNGAMASVIFYPIPVPGMTMPDGEGGEKPGQIPIAVLILVLGAIFFTVRMGLPQLRAFKHAIDVVRGKYDDPNDEGEVSSFQALTAALSATVGLGNIGGVAIAIGTGGPGATFWMILAGFLGMASKFTECSLGQMYREKRPDGRIMGGAMYYLSRGLGEMGMGGFGKVLAVIFSIICIGASLGGGNTFQANQSLGAVKEIIPFLDGREWLYGLIMAGAVAVVILGGITRIAKIAEKIVPSMCGIYLLACITILFMNLGALPSALSSIFTGAFDADAMFGGFLGVLITGFKRAAFSNEAGIGSAAIAHSAARVPHPSREGIVALLEPFIDTIIVCTMTALVIIITGAYNNPEYADLIASNKGAALTSNAMGSQLAFMPYVLGIAVVLFAYSTMISWSYYGERCWAYLFGDSSSIIYRLIFVVFVFLGSIATAQNVLDFGDLLIFGMVLPNIIGVVFLSGKVKASYDDYMGRLAAGEYKTFK